MVGSYRAACTEVQCVLAHLLVHLSMKGAGGDSEGLAVVDRYLDIHSAGMWTAADRLVELGLVVVGSPERLAETLAWLEAIGVDEVAVNPLFGLHPLKDVQRSLSLVAASA